MAVAVLVGGAPFELPAEIGHDLGPDSQLFVQEAQGGEWDCQFHGCAAGCHPGGDTGGPRLGDSAVVELTVLVGDREPPLRAAKRGGEVAGQLGVHRAPAGQLSRVLVMSEQGGQPHPQLHTSPDHSSSRDRRLRGCGRRVLALPRTAVPGATAAVVRVTDTLTAVTTEAVSIVAALSAIRVLGPVGASR